MVKHILALVTIVSDTIFICIICLYFAVFDVDSQTVDEHKAIHSSYKSLVIPVH